MTKDEIKSKVEKADVHLQAFQVDSKPVNVWNARNLLFEVKSDLKNLEIIEHNHKVKIPQFVADWISGYKDPIFEMCAWVEHYGSTGKNCDDPTLSKMLDWFGEHTEEFYKASLNGYKVEEEPRYWTVKTATDYLRLDTSILAISDKSSAQETAELISSDAIIEPVEANLKGYVYVTKEVAD